MTLKEKAVYYVETDDMVRMIDKSWYCHNFYIGGLGDIIFAESDDDNTTEYYFVIDGDNYGKMFAYSYTSEGDILHLYFD